MTPLAVFGITNDGLNLAVNLLLLFLVVFWIALVYWTYADARRRIEDPMLVGCATAASLFPFAGTIVYTIIRPPEFLEDVRERQLEIAAAEARLHQIEQHACPYCDYEVEKSFLRCPSCLRRLKEPCATCGKPLDPRWKICPYCEAEVAQAAPAQQGQPRRREPPPERRPRERAAPAAEPAPRAAAPRTAERPAARPPAKRQEEPRPPRREERPAEQPPERPAPQTRRPAAERPAERPPAAAKRNPPLPTPAQRKAASSRPKPQPKNSNSEQGKRQPPPSEPEGDERPSGERARP